MNSLVFLHINDRVFVVYTSCHCHIVRLDALADIFWYYIRNTFSAYQPIKTRELSGLLQLIGRIGHPQRVQDFVAIILQLVSFARVKCIIDCFEIFIERLVAFTARVATYLRYKKHNTVKVFIGIAPTGAITFISSEEECQIKRSLNSANF